MKMDDDNLLHLLPDHAYYAQVQGEMAVLDVEWSGFIVFSNDTIIFDRIIADYDYWINLLDESTGKVGTILLTACDAGTFIW